MHARAAVRCCGIKGESHCAATLKSQGDKIAGLKWNKLQAEVINRFTHPVLTVGPAMEGEIEMLSTLLWICGMFSGVACYVSPLNLPLFFIRSACAFRLTQMSVCLIRFGNCVPEQSNVWLPPCCRLSLVIYSK